MSFILCRRFRESNRIMKKNSIKNTRINQEVQRELSSLLQREVKDPRIAPMTSISAVEVTPDLKNAKVYVSVFGSEEAKEATMKGIKSAAPFLRSQLAKNLNLRNTPELRFLADDSIAYGVRMTGLIESMQTSEKEESEE